MFICFSRYVSHSFKKFKAKFIAPILKRWLIFVYSMPYAASIMPWEPSLIVE